MNEKEMKAIENMMCTSNILAATLPDIARQLTIVNEYRESELTVGRAIAELIERIADQGDNQIRHEIKDAVAEVRGNLDDALASVPPTPDALVEAVKKEVGDYDMLSAAQVFKILDKALATTAREKS